MNDDVVLLIVLLGFYLVDCLVWLRKQSIGFVCSWGRRWLCLDHGGFWATMSGRPALLNPVPPLGSAFVAHVLPVSLSPSAVCSKAVDAMGGWSEGEAVVVEFDDIESVAVNGCALMINGKKFARCVSENQTKDLCEIILKLKDGAKSKREGIIARFLESRFDVDGARDRLQEAERCTWWLAGPCNVLFFWLYVVFPTVTVTRGLLAALIWVMIPCVVLSAVTVVVFLRGHRKLYPHGGGERLTSGIKMVLFPPSTIRAKDKITLELFEGYHPLVAARLVLCDSDFQAFADRWMRDRFFSDDADDRMPAEAQWQRCAEWRLETEFARVHGVVEEKQAPVRLDPGARSYCPKCMSQYTKAEGECSDCGCALETLGR